MMDKTRREHILWKLRDGRTSAKKIEPKISSISSKKQVCSYTTVRHVALTIFPFSSIKMNPSHQPKDREDKSKEGCWYTFKVQLFFIKQSLSYNLTQLLIAYNIIIMVIIILNRLLM